MAIKGEHSSVILLGSDLHTSPLASSRTHLNECKRRVSEQMKAAELWYGQIEMIYASSLICSSPGAHCPRTSEEVSGRHRTIKTCRRLKWPAKSLTSRSDGSSSSASITSRRSGQESNQQIETHCLIGFRSFRASTIHFQ